jgi:hypothetical protein
MHFKIIKSTWLVFSLSLNSLPKIINLLSGLSNLLLLIVKICFDVISHPLEELDVLLGGPINLLLVNFICQEINSLHVEWD